MGNCVIGQREASCTSLNCPITQFDLESAMATIAQLEPVTLSKDEILRYSRHRIMPEVGMDGQTKL